MIREIKDIIDYPCQVAMLEKVECAQIVIIENIGRTLNMGDVSVNSTELEYMRLMRIRHELQDYRYYLLKRDWIDEKIAMLGTKLNGHIPALKTGEGSGGSAVEGNWIIAAIAEQDELNLLRDEIQRHISLVNTWLAHIEASLGREEMLVLSNYAITEGYGNADKCVEFHDLGSRSKLYRIIAKAESCILEKVKNFKNC